MQVTVTIEDDADKNKTLVIQSRKEKKVLIGAGNEARTVEGVLVERAIQNGLNVSSGSNENLFIQTRITEDEDGPFLVIENHQDNQELVIVKVGPEVRNINGRQLTTGIRHCLDSSK